MLQTELSNSSKNVAVNNIVAKTDKQADIVKRLAELNKWQEEQKKLLEERQTRQRQLLGVEQQTMYQMLGLHSDKVTKISEEMRSNADKNRQHKPNVEIEDYETAGTEDSSETSVLAAEDGKAKCADPASYKTVSSGYGTEDCGDVKHNMSKKPFLKRGDGLKQRFKIDPNELRLNNLPKYKYANAHPKLRLKPPTKIITAKASNKPSNSVNGEKLHTIPMTLDLQEQRFQNLLITSKNTCSSTPDKYAFSSNRKDSAKLSNISLSTEEANFVNTNSNNPQQVNDVPSNERITGTNGATQAMAWSKILDPHKIEPVQVQRNQKECLPQTEESIFELLEKKAINGSFDMGSTLLMQFMQNRFEEKSNETDDDIVIQEHLRNKRLEPVVTNDREEEACSSSIGEIEEDESQLTYDTETVESDNTTHKTIETTNSYSQQTQQMRVRFSESNETHEYEQETESTLNNSMRLTAGSSDGQGDISNNEFLEQFKTAISAVLHINDNEYQANDSMTNSKTYNNNSNSIYSPASKDLQEKTDKIKLRLSELEKEINNFKENNILLMKAKQNHELEKSLHAQEHLEAMERLKDEKIQMEIYLHDERVKLEDEKRQFEQTVKMKTQGQISKERKECERLRQQVIQLETQLKTKDASHTSAQARLRTQIRNLEREQNKLHEQIERLTMENKRLENENLKISREQNNKILLEINRNIAKLAPKQIQHSSTSMPEEGPPTLNTGLKTMSKCIVAAATANKNAEKAHETTNNRFCNTKSSSIKKQTPSSSVTGFKNEQQQQQHQRQNSHKQLHILENDEEDDDILNEFQTISNKRNSMTQVMKTESTNSDNKSPKNETPASPPSSPRCNNIGNNTVNMKREIVNADGSKDIWYPNGNLKKISADGMIIRMLYYNKDIKETNINEGTIKYYYAETNTWHTTYLDGLEILEFPNGQIEHRHKSGVVEVHYPNNSVKIMDPKDEHKQEEWRFADGTHLVQMRNGDKILSLPNGQKEIHNKLHKRREYPDGTVKIVYPDGSTETRYSNGRVRLKDKDGKLVMDTDLAK